MARGINKVILIGNLGRDPETRYTQGGSPVTNFSIATSESWKDKNTGQPEERTEWHNIVCFGRLAEIAGEYLRKGSKTYIEGSLRTSSWEDKEGQKRYRTEIICNEMQMLDGRSGGQQGGGQGGYPAADMDNLPGSGGGGPSRGNSGSGGGGGQRPAQQPQQPQQPADPFPADDPDDDIPF